MIRDICKDILILSKKAIPATKEDEYLIQDLIDTLTAHQQECVGMAANMIGFPKQMIIFDDNGKYVVMINPEIIQTTGSPKTKEEGCLCHSTLHEVIRYDKIKVKYQDTQFKIKIKTYQGFTAQIIQHEMDHLEGVLV